MSKKPYDLKSDPKFQARVKKLEGNQYSRLIKDPIEFDLQIPNITKVLIACIGINDTYLIVVPTKLNPEASFDFEVLWSKSDGFTTSTSMHDRISTLMINWTMLESNGEVDFNKVKHGSFNIKELAISSIAKKYGEDYFGNKEELRAYVQGTLVEGIKNPYHK